jgi:Ca2+-binding RTX toxin-like protein
MIRIKAGFALDMRPNGSFDRDLERAMGEVVSIARVSRSELSARTSTGAVLELRGRFDLSSEAALVNNSVLRSLTISQGGKVLFRMSGFELGYRDLDDASFLVLFSRQAVKVSGSPFDDILVGGLASDVLAGAGGHDRLNGGGGNDTLTGGGGDDRLNGGRGADIMRGGGGRDTYWVDDVRDQIIEAGAGHDRVHATVSYRLPSLVEDLVLGGAARIDATGNGLGNILIGNRAVNVLDGRGGNDVLDGGVGADRMLGGGGHDTYFVDNRGDRVIEQAGQGSDTVWSTISYTLPGNVENLQLRGAANLAGTGNGLGNVLIGNRGANILDGRAGDDWLFGGSGIDTLTGGPGADRFVFDTSPTATPDVITDFVSGVDGIFLDTSVFTALHAGPLAVTQFRTSDVPADGDDYLVYDSASGILSYDSSGSGAVELAPVAALGAGTTLVAADIIAAPDILPGLLFNGGQFTYRPDTAWSTGLVFQASSDGGFTQTIDLV